MATTKPGTEYEALMAALLGNVGKVREEIQRLPAELRGSVAPTITALNKTMVDAQASLKAYAKGMEAPIKIAATEQLALTRKAFDETANATLAAVALDLKKSTELHQRALSEEHSNRGGKRWVWIVLAFQVGVVASLVGSGLSIFGYKYLNAEAEEENANQAQYGRALIAAWPTLDEKAKKTITEASEKIGAAMKKLGGKKGQ